MTDAQKNIGDAPARSSRNERRINIVCSLFFSLVAGLLLSHKDYYVSRQSATLLSLLLTGSAFWVWARRGDDRPFFLFGCLGVLYAVAHICAPLLRATWSIADDYMIALMLNPSGSMTFQEFLEHCRRANSLGVVFGNTSGRFQPAFVLSYAVNTLLLGRHIQAWYLLYAGIFFGSVACMLLALKQLFNGVQAIAAGCLLLTVLQWHWLFRDTGVVEVYGLFGLALMAYILAKYHRSAQVPLSAYVLLTLGNFLIIGTKETLLLACLPVLVFLFLRCLRRRPGEGLRPGVFFALNLALALLVSCGVVAALLAKGTDAYGRQVQVAAFMGKTALYAARFADLLHLQAFLGILAVLLGMNMYRSRKGLAEVVPAATSLACGGLMAFFFVFGLSQYVFYHGAVDNQHYSIPFSAMPVLMWLTLAWYFQCTMATIPSVMLGLVSRACLTFLLCYFFIVTPSFSKDIITIFVETSRTYYGELELVAQTLATQPDRPLVLVVGPADNGEAVISPAVYLKKLLRVPNPIYVRPAPAAPPSHNAAGPANPALPFMAHGYIDVITPGQPPPDAAAYRLGIAAHPADGPGNLGQILPFDVAKPRLKLLPLLSYPLW